MIGKPKEHLSASIQAYVNKLAGESGFRVLDKKFHEPTKIEGSNEMFTTFTEVEVEFDSIDKLFRFTFQYMPANIEVISPTNIEISNEELSTLSNFLTTRLHDYDSVTKKLILDKDYILKQLRIYAPHLFKDENKGNQTSSLENQVKVKEDKKNNKKTKQKPEKKSKKEIKSKKSKKN